MFYFKAISWNFRRYRRLEKNHCFKWVVSSLAWFSLPHGRMTHFAFTFFFFFYILSKLAFNRFPICHQNEVQKRGLPHAHVLVWFEEKLRPEQFDKVISAEIPDPVLDPVLFKIVTSQMVHGPCGLAFPKSPCMYMGLCKKKYQRPFCSETNVDRDGVHLPKEVMSKRWAKMAGVGHAIFWTTATLSPTRPRFVVCSMLISTWKTFSPWRYTHFFFGFLNLHRTSSGNKVHHKVHSQGTGHSRAGGTSNRQRS